MCQTFRQTLVVLSVFIHWLVYGSGCVYEVCDCTFGTIDCESRNLTRLPAMTPTGDVYAALNFETNAITDLPAGSMPSNLKQLFMQKNPITTVADTVFDGSSSTLNTLYLSSALFTRIPDAFRHLYALNELSMQDLNITDWNEQAMENIGKTMVSLYLDNVGFTSWPGWLRYFSHLNELSLTSSSISSVPDGALDSSASTLMVLTMNNNKLTLVPKAFLKLTSLQQLYLQQNQIVDVTWLPPSNYLSVLWLNGNMVSDANILSNALRQYGNSLHDFDISSNRLISIPNITSLKLVGSLDLSNNRLTDPYSGAASSIIDSMDFTHNFLPAIPWVLKTVQVSVLTISFNAIKQIHGSDFSPSVTIVELGTNLISELTDDSFPANSTITDLNLNNNPIVTISGGAFKNLGLLTQLNLQGARLTRIPLALSSLGGLYMLDMSNNTNLVCTCQEKGLEQWIASKTFLNIFGSCGLLGISEFFSLLSQSCP